MLGTRKPTSWDWYLRTRSLVYSVVYSIIHPQKKELEQLCPGADQKVFWSNNKSNPGHFTLRLSLFSELTFPGKQI